ncbi:hypothetical protein MYX76_16725 [Desulfobacterota bacterium AH_259_B03_O07]|nr:hypothetical protein [Desulfobacterota bacterium AH_259_B03_O07]
MNSDEIICLRYIDDFLILAPTRRKVTGTFKSGLRVLRSLGLDAYDPVSNSDKAEIGKTENGINFLGCEIYEDIIRPNVQSRKRLLEKIDNIIRESQRLMKSPELCYKRRKSVIETLKSISNILEGWGNQYYYCNDEEIMNRLDSKVNKRIKKYLTSCREHIKSFGEKDRVNIRRILGVHLLQDSFIGSFN